MIPELRVYHCVSGRLPALLKRFETVILALWERHGIRQAGPDLLTAQWALPDKGRKRT